MVSLIWLTFIFVLVIFSGHTVIERGGQLTISDIRLQHIFTMTRLLLLGARFNYIEITTTELGKNINRSQQAASKHLLDLENEGYLERIKKGQKFAVKITDKGYLEIESLYKSLKSVMETFPKILYFQGRVVSGMGEGAYYVSLPGYKEQFKEKLGFEPYPGTLNIKLIDQTFMRARRDIGKYPSVLIDGFSDGSRTYGWVKCFPASINDGIITQAAVLVLERTHYDDTMLEVIAPVSIKEIAGITNGDIINVSVFVQGITGK